MADMLDIATAIASALDEIGVSGELIVTSGDEKVQRMLGWPLGDRQEIIVAVRDRPKFETMTFQPLNGPAMAYRIVRD